MFSELNKKNTLGFFLVAIDPCSIPKYYSYISSIMKSFLFLLFIDLSINYITDDFCPEPFNALMPRPGKSGDQRLDTVISVNPESTDCGNSTRA